MSAKTDDGERLGAKAVRWMRRAFAQCGSEEALLRIAHSPVRSLERLLSMAHAPQTPRQDQRRSVTPAHHEHIGDVEWP